MTGVSMLHNEVQKFLDGPAVTDYIQAKSPAAKAGIHSGDPIVHYDTVENPTWDDLFNRSILNLNQTIPFSFTHNGQRTDTKLFVESKGQPEDFSPFDQLGFIPKMQDTPVQVSSLEPSMPAARAGLQPGDKILSIDGLQLHSVPALLGYLQDQAGKPASLTVQRTAADGTSRPFPSRSPRNSPTPQPAPRTIASASSPSFLPSGSSAYPSARHGRLLAVQQKELPPHRRGHQTSLHPPGLGQEPAEPHRHRPADSSAAQMPGWTPLIGTMSLISINLGILNLMPIPILDGGMILFLLIETIMRRDINQQVKERIYQVAFVCILAFFAFVIFNDLTRLNLFTKLKP